MGPFRSSHLHEDLETVQRSCACPRHSTSHCASHQLLPPHAGKFLLLGELIRHRQAFTNVQDLSMGAAGVMSQQRWGMHLGPKWGRLPYEFQDTPEFTKGPCLEEFS